MNAKLTAKETALMAQIARNGFSFFDEGLVAGSGIWSDALTHECGTDVSTTARGAATVMSSLCRKGLLFSDQGSYSEGDGAWVELTEAGEAWIAEHNGETYAETVARIKAEREAAKAAPVETVEDLIGTDDITVTEVDGVKTESYTTTDKQGREVQWTEITFPDASRTIKRRQKVSGAWRTDYWGAEFAGDAEHATTSAKVKAALAARTFTR